MIVSHKHKFIFLKTQKTGGTSVETGLSQFCGEDDIITPDDEVLRIRMGYPASRNCGYDKWRNYTLRDWYRLIKRGRRKIIFYNHMPAREILSLVGEDVWNSYFKFCFERNPWDKTISYYHFKYRFKKGDALSQFIHSNKLYNASDWRMYTLADKPAVDFVGRYENLDEDLATICKKIDVPVIKELPRLKGNIRKDHQHYHDVLSRHDTERISEVFSKEIEHFGYRY